MSFVGAKLFLDGTQLNTQHTETHVYDHNPRPSFKFEMVNPAPPCPVPGVLHEPMSRIPQAVMNTLEAGLEDIGVRSLRIDGNTSQVCPRVHALSIPSHPLFDARVEASK